MSPTSAQVQLYFYEHVAEKLDRLAHREIVLGMLRDFSNANKLGVPNALAFNVDGMPFVENIPSLKFSYSHSKRAVMLAVTNIKGMFLGVDIEPIDRLVEVQEIAKSAFTKKELAAISKDSMLAHWTLKEAALKMLGKGFSDGEPNEYSVDVSGGHLHLNKQDKPVLDAFANSFIYQEHTVSLCSNLLVDQNIMKKIIVFNDLL